MGLSVSSAPAGFQPVGAGELIYSFVEADLSAKPNFRVQVEFEGFDIPVIEFFPEPDADGLNVPINCDIAPALRSLLRVSDAVGDRLQNTYVKYQAVWDGGSDAQVPLTTDVIYFYIGSSQRGFSRDQYEIRAEEQLTNGAFTTNLSGWTNQASANGFTNGTVDWTWNNGAPVSVARARVSFGGGLEYSKILEQQITIPAGSYQLVIVSGILTADSDIKINLYDGLGNYQTIVQESCTFPSGATSPVNFTTTRQFKYIGIQWYNTSGGVFECYVDSISLLDLNTNKFLTGVETLKAWSGRKCLVDFLHWNNLASGSEVRFYPSSGGSTQLTTFDGTTYGLVSTEGEFTGSGTIKVKKTTAPETVYAEIDVEIQDECSNPILLEWLNNFGGLVSWLFDYEQIFDKQPVDDGVFDIYQVVALNVTLDEWKMLNELNKSGDELTDNQKLGAFVQDITDDDNPINVFVEPSTASTSTKKSAHIFLARLRYPLTDNIEI